MDDAIYNPMLTINDWHTPSQSTRCDSSDPTLMSWSHTDAIDFNQFEPDVYPSWAGYTLESPSAIELSSLDASNQVLQNFQASTPIGDPSLAVFGRMDVHSSSFRNTLPGRNKNLRATTETEEAAQSLENPFVGTIPQVENAWSSHAKARFHTKSRDPEAEHLLSLFTKIVQPPAAILISGVKNWRRLQRHLVAMSESCEAVFQALLCVSGVLFTEEAASYTTQNKALCLNRISERHRLALDGVQDIVSNKIQTDQTVYEPLLAAILLLAWYEVIRDQDGHAMPFPRDLADAAILSDMDWSRVSRQLLSWLCVLDGKATYSSGEPLLSKLALRAVARYPIQVVSADPEEWESETEHDSLEAGLDTGMKQPPQHLAGSSAGQVSARVLTSARIKQIVLQSVIQPAVEWHVSTQAFCRRIGSHDRHHRSRGTPDDEYTVILASKQLEKDLWEIWRQRPTIMSLTRNELVQSLPLDLAIRLEELFNLHFASFWILFVYLHRVTWWYLPHSPAVTAALNNVWQHLQNSYGEVVDGARKKILHPNLLWPLFLFGTECPEKYRQTWAIEQLEALGEPRPVPNSPGHDLQDLPPFRLSPGATKNAKRAALLLKELIKEQNESNARVDDRQLSVQMFGCYFSLV